MVERNLARSLDFRRSRVLFVLVIIIWAVFIGRLFYIQVLRNDYYRSLATESQERKFEIDAQRGGIYVMDRETKRPLVLNENLPTVFADPRYVDDKAKTAEAIADILGGDSDVYLEILNRDTAFAIIKKKVSLEIANEIDEAELKGIGTLDEYYRAYPEGQLASQVLGFVNNDGEGQYGIEEYLDEELEGTPGKVEAITDVRGVPLRGDDSGIISDPISGSETTLTIDINLQKQVEESVKAAVEKGSALGGAAVVIDPNSGAIKAMANFPTYDPDKFASVEDFSVFQNSVVTNAYEAGSVIKPFTMATGINEGVVTRNSIYYDTGFVQVDDRRIENAGDTKNLYRDMDDVIQFSVNTGAVHVLSELGSGDINSKSRIALHTYFTERFGFGSILGIEQASESKGVIFSPTEGDGLNVRYANMTFGQGMTTTMLQVASATAGLVNGGTMYKPYLVESIVAADGQSQATDPVIIRSNVIDKDTSKDLKAMLRLVVQDGGGRSAKKDGYRIGGKTGTAQVALPDGTYSEDRQIGSFVGYIEGGDGLEYVIMTRVDEPQGYRFAGSGAAAPMFAEIAHWLIDYERIPPVD